VGPDTVRFQAGGLTLVGVGVFEGERRHAVVRGEDVVLARTRPGPSSARNVLEGVVVEIAAEGALARVTVDVAGVPLVASLTTRSVAELGLAQGVAVVATVKATAVHLC
jgi:molybdopterin-binding protein